MSGWEGKRHGVPRVTRAVFAQEARHVATVAAVRRSGGSLAEAARLLNIAPSTFTRYVTELRIGGEVTRIAREATAAATVAIEERKG